MNQSDQFRRILNISVAVPLLVMVLLAVLLSGQIYQMLDSARWVDHTDEVIAQATEIMKDMVDRQTSLRGYILTGKPDFLRYYKDESSRIPDELNALEKKVSDNPEQMKKVGSLRAEYRQWDEMASRLKEASQQTLDSPTSLDLIPEQNQMTQIRELVNGFTETEQGLRRIRSNTSQQQAQMTLYYTGGLSVCMGGVLAFFTRSRFRVLGQSFHHALVTERAARDETEMAREEVALKAQELATINAELEERVLARTAELEDANKELAAFSYSVSHDLRAPLRSIDGFSVALMEDYGASFDALGKSYLTRIRANSQTMADLIDGMLTLSRLTRADLRHETLDMTALAEEVIEQLREREPQRHVEFVSSGKIKAQGDGRLIRNVLENLLGNAWKFTSRRENARIEFGAKQEAGQTVYHVRDNGAGFDMAYADKLFGAFQRLHGTNEYAGTGIGLATVQRIIRRHGGRIWAEAEVDKGATFYFTLPN